MIAADRPVLRSPPDRLIADWTFAPSPVRFRTRIARVLARRRRLPPPESEVVRAVTPSPRWNCLFLYAPTGALDAVQRRMVARLAAMDGRLLVVVACSRSRLSAGLDAADALIWKDLGGFDFSAYALALDAVARCSPGALVYLQNDSVLGPFGGLEALIARARWDLTGFVASRAVENHLSSFALILRDVTPARVRALSPALSTRWRHDGFRAVVLDQETRLAAVAARSMSVGAFWYAPDAPAPARTLLGGGGAAALDLRGDPMLALPLAMVDLGLPFVKRSLFTKFAGLTDEAALRARLRGEGWA